MNLATKQRILEIADERRNGISAEKGPEYAGTAERYADDDRDVLANFKRQGDRWGTSPLLPTGVYFGKHIDSIETFVREATREGLTLREQRELAYKGEGILSRLDDARNYLDLMECLLVDLGILNDPRPEAYNLGGSGYGIIYSTDDNSLVTLGDVTYADVVAADDEALHRFVDDYNYMRERVGQLRQLQDEVSHVKYAARMKAEALLERDIEDQIGTEPEDIAAALDDDIERGPRIGG